MLICSLRLQWGDKHSVSLNCRLAVIVFFEGFFFNYCLSLFAIFMSLPVFTVFTSLYSLKVIIRTSFFCSFVHFLNIRRETDRH